MTKNIVFIDSRVAGYETLIANLGADTEWYLLEASQDGMDQMQRILSAYSGLESVQIISHGSIGTLYLGSTVLNSDNLTSYQTQLRAIGSSLTETGDILLYGCNVAQGDVGVSFVNLLAQITGADVAASDDSTGSVMLGGDWALEKQIGIIDTNGIANDTYTSILLDDYAASTATTGTLTVGGTKTGSIDVAGDYDWFKLTLTAGLTYKFEALGFDTSNGTLADPYLELYSGSGVFLAFDDDNGTGLNSSFTYTPSTSGTYYLSASEAADSYTGTYTVRASTIADDYAASTATTGTLTVGGTKIGSIEVAGDYDWFKVYFTVGTTYTINLKGSPSGAGTLTDPNFDGIYDAQGYYVYGTGNDDYGSSTESFATFTPTTSGYYYLSATSYGSDTGTYQFSVTGQANIDLPATTATTATVALNGSYRSEISPSGDVDWIKASLTAGTSYVIELNADNSAANPLYDPKFLGIYNSSGALIAGTANDDYGIGTNSRVTFTPTASGNYYLAASGYGTTVGAYELRLLSTSNGTDTEGETTATAAAMSVGAAKSGTINYARDVDWFKVSLAAGQAYQITARGSDSGAGTLVDPEIVGIYNASGQIFPGTGNDDAYGTLDAETIFTPGTAGYYYVGVKAANDGTGTYSVAVNTAAASNDLPANSTTSAILQAGTPQSSAIDSAGDIDWIGVNLVAGTSYQINMLGAASSNGTLADPVINGVFTAGGAALAQTADDDSGTGTNAMISFTVAQSGTYYASVGGYGANTGTYQLTLTQTGADTTAPTLLATSPTNGSLSVAASTNLSIDFSEAVRAGSGNITLTGGGTIRTIAVTDTSQVSFNGSTMTINPSTNLASNTDYAVTFGTGVVRDLAGNSFAGITSSTQFNFHTAAPGTLDNWTVMVYMAADNNLESFAIADLNEMESVTLPSSVNVSVLLDRAPGYDTSNGNWTDTRTGTVTHDSNTSTISSSLTSLGERNTGDGSTLTNFINSTVASNPASHYALIVWDHGGGLSGTSWDDSSGNDNLSLAEFVSAVSASTVGHFDFIGFDACLQGMVEQAWDVRNLSDVLVASQELEPGDGWEYDKLLRTLANNPTSSSFDLANAAVDAYGTRYNGEANTTLSATRLSALGSLKTELDGFINNAISTGTGILSQLVAAATRATPINNADDGYRDLGDFMREIVTALPGTTVASSAQKVITALQLAVLSQAGTVAGANGLSIYLPTTTIDSGYDMQNQSFLQGTGWGNFLRFMLNDQNGNYLVGDSSTNDIRGFGGNDTIIGGSGNDLLSGGNGSDSLDGGPGTDTVSYADASSAINVSLAITTGQATGGSGTDTLTTIENLTGSNFNDTLIGSAGNNVLDGGSGNDSLVGGLGNDTYIVNVLTDVITELAGGGTDTVQSAITYSLLDTDGVGGTNGGNVENLTLTGNGAVNATGNALNNNLTGNSGANTLTGDAGNDTLTGGAGADNLNGGSNADLIIINAVVGTSSDSGRAVIANTTTSVNNDKGQDTLTSFSLTEDTMRIVASNVSSFVHGTDTAIGIAGADVAGTQTSFTTSTGLIELNQTTNNNWQDAGDIALTFVTPSTPLTKANFEARLQYNLTGTTGANTFTGGVLNDVFKGGAGADVLNGGGGSDTADYSDKTTAVTATLNGAAVIDVKVNGVNEDRINNIENLTGGAGNDIFTGDNLANTLNGGAGNDILTGGLANDALTGGTGLDRFVFASDLGSTNIDTITDFSVVDDTILLDNDFFLALGVTDNTAGVTGVGLTATTFQLGTAANDAGDRIIYDQTSGKLYYDADGTGTGAQVQIALIGTTSHAALAAADFLVVA